MEIERKIFVQAEGCDGVNETGERRQDLLMDLQRDYGETLELCKLQLSPFLNQDLPAYYVLADKQIVGVLPDWLSQELYDYGQRGYQAILNHPRITNNGAVCVLSFLLCLVSPEEIRKFMQQQATEAAPNKKSVSPAPPQAEAAPQPPAPKKAEVPKKKPRPAPPEAPRRKPKPAAKKARPVPPAEETAPEDERARLRRLHLLPLNLLISLVLLAGGIYFFAKNTILMDLILVIFAAFTIWWASAFVGTKKPK